MGKIGKTRREKMRWRGWMGRGLEEVIWDGEMTRAGERRRRHSEDRRWGKRVVGSDERGRETIGICTCVTSVSLLRWPGGITITTSRRLRSCIPSGLCVTQKQYSHSHSKDANMGKIISLLQVIKRARWRDANSSLLQESIFILCYVIILLHYIYLTWATNYFADSDHKYKI